MKNVAGSCRALIFCVLWPLLGCGSVAHAEAPRGFIYKVVAPGAESGAVLYLYGTLHLGSAAGEGLDAPTRDLIGKSSRLAIELDPRNTAAIGHALQTFGLYPVGDSLARHISEALMARTATRAEQLTLPEERIEQMRPWVAANLLSVLTLAATGLDPRRGSEALLTAAALGANVPVIEIEGADVQFKLLGGAPEATQVDALRRTLDGLDDGRIASEAKRLISAWQTHDASVIEKMLIELHEEPGLFPQFMASQLISARDASMTDAAIAELNLGGQTFFAVGALHLFGDDGLISQLRKRGYSVTSLN
jgi:uncharacterized protein YbaP (TraB family)